VRGYEADPGRCNREVAGGISTSTSTSADDEEVSVLCAVEGVPRNRDDGQLRRHLVDGERLE
jgi:hypothetical protein